MYQIQLTKRSHRPQKACKQEKRVRTHQVFNANEVANYIYSLLNIKTIADKVNNLDKYTVKIGHDLYGKLDLTCMKLLSLYGMGDETEERYLTLKTYLDVNVPILLTLLDNHFDVFYINLHLMRDDSFIHGYYAFVDEFEICVRRSVAK